MRSTNTRNTEDAESSLSESTYEALPNLGDSLYEASDDDCQTESLASTDGRTPDDGSSIAGSDDDIDFVPEHTPEHEEYPTEDSVDMLPSRPSPEESMITSRADTQVGEQPSIALEEIPARKGQYMEGRAVLRRFNQSQPLPPVLSNYGCPELQFTLKLGLSETPLTLSRPFRILYLGDFQVWAEEDIARHISAALQAPQSLANQADTDHDVLLVDHCRSPNLDKEFEESSTGFTTDDGVDLSFIRPAGPDNKLPDLVICCQPAPQGDDDSRVNMENLRLARMQFKRHGIPCLDLCMVRPYCQCPPSFDFDTESLRLCVEGRESNSTRFKLQETLPLDISVFLSIDVMDLNRHFRLVTKAQDSEQSGEDTLLQFRVEEQETTGQPYQGIRDAASWFKSNPRVARFSEQRQLWFVLLPLAAALLAFFLAIHPLDYRLPANSIPVTTQTQEVKVHIPVVPSSTSTHKAPFISSISSVAAPPRSVPSLSTPSDLTVVPTKEKKQPKRKLASAEESLSGGYDIAVLGDHEFTLQPKHELASRKNAPKLSILVTRDTKPVPVITSRLANGIYTVSLEDEYPFGSFEVNIATKPKPLLRQTFEIQLGYTRSHAKFTLSSLAENVERLQERAKEVLEVAQHNLNELSVHVSDAIEKGLVNVDAAHELTAQWYEHAHESAATVAEHISETAETAGKLLSKQLSDVSRATKEVSEQVQRTFWRQTRPARTHKAVLKARKKALRLRDQMEKKLGKVKKVKEKREKKEKGWCGTSKIDEIRKRRNKA